MDTLTAYAIHLELGADWARFEKAHRVGSWLGLTPSREQSGAHDRHGQITQTGATLARRLLVKSAWHAAREPRLGANLANRQQGPPDHVLQIANRASERLQRIDTGMHARGKPHNVTVVAVTQELAHFPWAAATAPSPSPSPPNSSTPGSDQKAGTPGRHRGRHARSRYEQPHPGRHARS